MKSLTFMSRAATRHARSLARVLLGAVFLVAGALKIAHPVDFHSDLLAYDVPLPDVVFRLVAVVLPWLEAICGAALLATVWTETAGAVVTAMCLAFVVMLGQAVMRGLELTCGCLGPEDEGWFDRPGVALIRAAVLLVGSVWLWLNPTENDPSGSASSGRRETPDQLS